MLDLEPANLTIVRMPDTLRGGAGRQGPLVVLAALLIALAGIALRLWLPVGFNGMGFDEALYRIYVLDLDVVGLGDYDTITQNYLVDQRRADAMCKLPPTRFLYVYAGWLWKRAEFGDAPSLDVRQQRNVERDPALVSLHQVSRLFSILLLLLSGAAAWRMFGKSTALVVLALMATAPLQLHMAGHALIDGFFAFWAMLVLWSLWENLRQPRHTGWLGVYGASLVLLIMTKENAFFVVVGIAALLAVNRWAKFGTITPRLLLMSLLGPVLGAAILVKLAGGLPRLVEVYHLLVTKAEHLDYAILTGGGPWHRYLIDEIIVSPFVVCLAIGGIFGLARRDRSMLFLAGFVIFTYAVMCQVPHGMNLRYATIWSFPLCALAAGQLLELSAVFERWAWSERGAVTQNSLLSSLIWRFERWPGLRLGAVVAGICAYELWQYWLFFVHNQLYEIPTESLLRAVDILKS